MKKVKISLFRVLFPNFTEAVEVERDKVVIGEYRPRSVAPVEGPPPPVPPRKKAT